MASTRFNMSEMRALFVQRLETVDQRFPNETKAQRDYTRKKLRKMIASIDAGTLNLPQLADQPEGYHGEL